MTKEAIGTEKVFYDITRADREGYFGTDPVIWKAQEFHVALELLASGLDLEGKAWDDYVHHSTMWSDGNVERSKPTASQLDGLKRNSETSSTVPPRCRRTSARSLPS